MMNDAEMLAAYQAMAELSRQMLASTGEREWDELTGQERELDVLFARLQQDDAGQRRPADVLRRKQALIEETLENQALQRKLALEWREAIASLLGSVDSARRIAHAYR